MSHNEQPYSPPQQPQSMRVTVTDVDISFAQMVTLILKFTFACIPAAIILTFVGAMVMLGVAAIGAGAAG